MEYKKINLDGYTLHVLKTDKFKTTQLGIRFKSEMDRNSITYRSLLPFILKAKTDKYSSKKEISKAMEELYGAGFSSKVSRYGKCNIISFDFKIVNERFLHTDRNLLKESCEFINDIITNHTSFDEEVVKEEIRLLDIDFEQEYNNKTKWALNEMMEIMLEDETYRFRAMGVREDLEDITKEDLFNEYQEMLSNNEIDVIVCGDLSEEQINIIKSTFKFKGQVRNIDIIDTEDKEIESVKIKEEIKEISQGKLNMGYRIRTRIGDSLEGAASVYNALLGGNSNSKLFMNVREKHSLCYYCASNIDLNKGLMYIYAGIESAKYDKAVSIIREQVKEMTEGKFTEGEIAECKQSILNDYFEALDSQGTLLAKMYIDSLRGYEFDIDRIVTKINSVTKEEIIEVAKLVEEDTVFFLTNKAVL